MVDDESNGDSILSLEACLADPLPTAVDAEHLITQIAFEQEWLQADGAREWIVVGGDDASEVDAVTIITAR